MHGDGQQCVGRVDVDGRHVDLLAVDRGHLLGAVHGRAAGGAEEPDTLSQGGGDRGRQLGRHRVAGRDGLDLHLLLVRDAARVGQRLGQASLEIVRQISGLGGGLGGLAAGGLHAGLLLGRQAIQCGLGLAGGRRCGGRRLRCHLALRLLQIAQRPALRAVLGPAAQCLGGHGSDGAQALPASLVVRQVGLARLGLAVEADHHLVLVELAGLGVDLVDDEDGLAGRVLADECIQLVAVCALAAVDLAVVVAHRRGPGLAILVGAGAHRACRVLDVDLHAVQLDRALDVLARFLLLGRGLWQVVQGRGGGQVGRGVDVGLQGLIIGRGRCRRVGLGQRGGLGLGLGGCARHDQIGQARGLGDRVGDDGGRAGAAQRLHGAGQLQRRLGLSADGAGHCRQRGAGLGRRGHGITLRHLGAQRGRDAQGRRADAGKRIQLGGRDVQRGATVGGLVGSLGDLGGVARLLGAQAIESTLLGQALGSGRCHAGREVDGALGPVVGLGHLRGAAARAGRGAEDQALAQSLRGSVSRSLQVALKVAVGVHGGRAVLVSRVLDGSRQLLARLLLQQAHAEHAREISGRHLAEAHANDLELLGQAEALTHHLGRGHDVRAGEGLVVVEACALCGVVLLAHGLDVESRQRSTRAASECAQAHGREVLHHAGANTGQGLVDVVGLVADRAFAELVAPRGGGAQKLRGGIGASVVGDDGGQARQHLAQSRSTANSALHQGLGARLLAERAADRVANIHAHGACAADVLDGVALGRQLRGGVGLLACDARVGGEISACRGVRHGQRVGGLGGRALEDPICILLLLDALAEEVLDLVQRAPLGRLVRQVIKRQGARRRIVLVGQVVEFQRHQRPSVL